MLNCCIFCMNLPLLIFQQAFCCPILKQWSWKLAAGSLFIFSLQQPGFCNLTSTHGIWQGVLLVNLERQSDCRRTVVELRYQCGRSARQRPSWQRRRPPQILPAAAAAKAALVPVQLRRTLLNLWKYEFTRFEKLVFFVNFHRMSIEKP